MAELTAALALGNSILGLIATGIMTVQRGREVFGEFEAKLQSIHAEGRSMSPEELAAYFDAGDQIILAELKRVGAALQQINDLPG